VLDRISGEQRVAWVARGALVAVWLVLVVANYFWLKLDTRPPFWDMAGHSIAALRIARLLRTTGFPAVVGKFLLANENGYPPLVYQLSAPLAILFGPSADALLGVNGIFVGILLISTYGIAMMMRGHRTGLLAALVTSVYPILCGLSRHFLLDFPLVAMVTLSTWLLLRTDEFENRAACAVYGLSLGLGMLTKWTFAIFVLGPFLMVTVRTLSSDSRRRATNIALALAVGAIVAAPWYLRNLSVLLDVMGMQSVWAGSEGDPAVGSLRSWTYYLRVLVNDQLLLPLTVFFVLSCVILMVEGQCRFRHGLLFLWIAVPFLAFSCFVNKDVRFTMPYLPAIGVITALGLAAVRPQAIRMLLIASLILFAVVQYAGLTFGLSGRLGAHGLPSTCSIPLGSYDLRLYAEGVHIASPPRAENWPAPAMLDTMTELAQALGVSHPLQLTVVPNVPCFEPNVFIYHALAKDLPLEVSGVTGVVAVSDARRRILTSDFVVTKTHDQGPAWTLQDARSLTESLDTTSTALGSHVELIGEHPLPDGSVGRLYRGAAMESGGE